MGKTQVEVRSSCVTTLARWRNTTVFKLHSFNIATQQPSKFVDILKSYTILHVSLFPMISDSNSLYPVFDLFHIESGTIIALHSYGRSCVWHC